MTCETRTTKNTKKPGPLCGKCGRRRLGLPVAPDRLCYRCRGAADARRPPRTPGERDPRGYVPPAEVEGRIRLYAARAAAGLDLFTGRKGGAP